MLTRFIVLSAACAAALGDNCQALCDSHPACAKSKFGSYCKTNGVCFGFYHKGHGYCFQPTEQATCDDSVLKPVSCQDTCQQVCDSLPSCKGSKYGSYCKTWQNPPVCFGIIQKADKSLCFHPADPQGCNGDPYPCTS
ncbi:hypothetical protein FOL47_010110 [Perkinsus chesapeaki]|uniref:Uncharacterized protein n=1 Tax=Perkinsus chesapeaki TaxID=330153 RepID=A0A7J6L3U4_PERCH|nr:hypothetical protein FOL47_010110 [Perkinsus chesapeaki]